MQKLIKIIKDVMAKITVNGVSHIGHNITISKNRVIIDGIDVTPDEKHIDIKVEGNVDTIKSSSGDVTVSGRVGSISTKSGDIEVDGNVNGSVNTMSGDIECGSISGSVTTMSGDISKHHGKRF